MPGIEKMTSTMIAPPIRVPTLSPATVSSVRLDGRRAWRHSTRRGDIPLDLAMVMKSSWSVAIMSLRSRRMYTAIWPTARLIAGRTCAGSARPGPRSVSRSR